MMSNNTIKIDQPTRWSPTTPWRLTVQGNGFHQKRKVSSQHPIHTMHSPWPQRTHQIQNHTKPPVNKFHTTTSNQAPRYLILFPFFKADTIYSYKLSLQVTESGILSGYFFSVCLELMGNMHIFSTSLSPQLFIFFYISFNLFFKVHVPVIKSTCPS